jgi:hypothetical protein
MIRAPRLVVSRPMYAFKPDTWRTGVYVRQVDAVWFKRKGGRLVAVMGRYSPMVTYGVTPDSYGYADWIAAADDNRYGGHHIASWDGTALLCTDPPAVDPETSARYIQFLDQMLRGFPDVPAGYDGWFTFPRTRPAHAE